MDNSPLTATEILQKYFVENRSRLLDLAAFLDRIQRAENSEAAFKDNRIQCLLKGIEVLLDSEPKRTERIQTILSDLTPDILDSKPLEKNAQGAPKNSVSCC